MKKHILLATTICWISIATVCTSCRNEFHPVGTITLSVQVETGNEPVTRSFLYPATGMMEFTNGDVIYVANNGIYIGKLTFNAGVFRGEVATPSTDDYLHLYFLGNKNPGDIYPGDTDCMVRINDQADELPHLAYGKSLTKYSSPDQTYICLLQNQCGLIEINFFNGTDDPVMLHDVKTVAMIDFSDPDHPVTPRNNRGTINLFAHNRTQKYAVLLPQDAMNGITMTIGDESYSINLPQIQANHGYIGKNAVYKDARPILIDFTATSGTKSSSYESHARLVDRTTCTKWCVNKNDRQGGLWFVEFNSRQPFTPTEYALITGDDNEQIKGQNPKDWKLMAKAGENDEWTVISTVNNDRKMEDRNLTPYTFPLDVTDRQWQYFRFEVSNNQGNNMMQLSELQFYASDIEETEEPLIYIPDNATEPPRDNYFHNLFDDDYDTMWDVNRSDKIDGLWFGEFHTNKPVKPVGYAMATSVEDRWVCSPVHWRLMAKAREFGEWQTIAEERDNFAMASRRTSYYFPLSDTDKTWQYFRLEVSNARDDIGFNPTDGTILQLSEFRFYLEGENTPEPAVNPGPPKDPERELTDESFVATSGSQGIAKAKNYDKCVDGDTNTCWETKEDKKTNGVWFVEFYRMTPFAPTGYTIYCKDYYPQKFKLFARKSENDSWTLVSSQVVSDWRYPEVRSFNLDKPGETWQYFRFEVSEQERTSVYCDRIAIREILFH